MCRCSSWHFFVLQTRFRAELQEDIYYSEYLSKKTAELVKIDRSGLHQSLIEPSRQHLIAAESKQSKSVVGRDVGMDLGWTGWEVALNARHPRFRELREAFRNANIPISENFGDNEHATVPGKWIVALSKYLPDWHKIRILKTLTPFHFDGFQLWIPEVEAGETADVYVGSYGNGKYVQITEEFADLLASEFESVDLQIHAHEHTAIGSWS